MLKNKQHWGHIIWNFLHCFLYNIKNEDFKKYKCEIINIINEIGTNLPCMLCSNHYKENNYIEYEKIFSIDCLIYHLWNAHNIISQSNNNMIYDYSILDQYKKKDFNKVKESYLNLLILIDSSIIDSLKEKLNILNF